LLSAQEQRIGPVPVGTTAESKPASYTALSQPLTPYQSIMHFYKNTAAVWIITQKQLSIKQH